MLIRSSSAALACLLACSCAHDETRERQLRDPSEVTRAYAEPSVLPDSAFRSDAELRGTRPTPPSRFETRRIGSDEEGKPRAHYRGAPIDLDVKNAELSEVFRLLADVGHVNIVVSGEVTGTITLRLEHVPWDQALDVIARAKSLALEREGNVILVRAHG